MFSSVAKIIVFGKLTVKLYVLQIEKFYAVNAYGDLILSHKHVMKILIHSEELRVFQLMEVYWMTKNLSFIC